VNTLQYASALLTGLALVPGVLFLLDRAELSVVLSLACVVVIAASLAWMFRPAQNETESDRGTAPQR
jgi:hypothetical protein